MNPDTYKVARGKSVIDVVREDLGRLQSINMSATDKRKLTKWTELLHYTGGSVMGGAMCNMTTAQQLGLTGTLTGGNITKTANVFMDLAVLTALCDGNRVIFMKMPANGNFSAATMKNAEGMDVPVQYVSGSTMKNLPSNTDAHSISHRIGNAGMGGQCVADAINMIHAIDKYYAYLFSYLVGRLDSFSEGDAKLLDNTATVWFQEMSDGNSHNLNNAPIVHAGSCGGYFKTGQAVNVENAMPNMSRGNSDSDCANGSTTNLDGVGTPSNTANAPINKYFCNLLNAIGARADSTGYATPGGTMPVTKFGKYDNTLYFKNGGEISAGNVRPATIDSPGEFTALRPA
jgi:hypothetical protein